jgi:hypothetical protein
VLLVGLLQRRRAPSRNLGALFPYSSVEIGELFVATRKEVFVFLDSILRRERDSTLRHQTDL